MISVQETPRPQGVKFGGGQVSQKERNCALSGTGQSILKGKNPRSSSSPCAVVRALDMEGMWCKRDSSLLEELRINYLKGGNGIGNLVGGRRKDLEGFHLVFYVSCVFSFVGLG